MRGFKHIKFSRGTARQNPEMIEDAYEKLINNITQKIVRLYINKEKITVELSQSVFQYLTARQMDSRSYKSDLINPLEVKVSPAEILNLYPQVIKQHENEIRDKEILRDVQEEYARFIKKFNRKRFNLYIP